MSRQFGSCQPGYFHSQIMTASEDCQEGNDELTRLWGDFLGAFYPIAYAIASSEAGDSGPDLPIKRTLEHLPKLRQCLDDIEQFAKGHK